MFYRLFILFSAALILGCGCSKKTVPDPPLARAELTLRLNDALKLARYGEAISIIDKLLALDPDDADLMDMRDRIIGNICVERTQQYIDRKELEKALKYVQKQRRQYPMLPRLQILEAEVSNLIAMRDAAAELARAKTIPELTAALEKITPMAAGKDAAKILAKDIQARKKELAAMRDAAARKLKEAVQATRQAPEAGDKNPPDGDKKR